MLYLKYRPRSIEELDNTTVKDTLRHLLASENLPHALLLVGQKGTGKTSTARIIAKAVNCLENKFAGKGKSIEPCNKCKNCLSIEQGGSPDVVELDAASNRGIDEVRSLIRESSFSPMMTRYRVFIIDEAHMITNDAFNALLKTLEEPPSSVLFIMATTNEEKVPNTIRSRCVTIRYGKAKKTDVIMMLKRVAKSENISLPDETLQVIAAHSERSFRDATKLLEEIVTQQKKTPEEVQEYIGLRDHATLLKRLETGTLQESLQWIESFVQSGGSVKNLLEQLLEEMHLILLAKNGVKTEGGEEYSFTNQEISFLMKSLTEAYSLLRVAPLESIPVELAITEFYNTKK